MVVADSYAITPSLLNEARVGATTADQRFITGIEARQIIDDLGRSRTAKDWRDHGARSRARSTSGWHL
jgi:hypothetical protein